MRSLVVLASLVLVAPLGAMAQSNTLSGHVTGTDGQALAGVRVEEKGTLNRAFTDASGRYVLRYGTPGATIRFVRFGYQDREIAAPADGTLDVVLTEGIAIEGVEVVGSRRQDRSDVSTPVAVDIIPIAEVTQRSGQLDLNQLLQHVAPSFNANRQSGADGSDHIDPATLRGLGPDQTLVLINGKRRHQSSLINIFGSRGRGNTGTDLNAIPVSAIERIEILRDGASAQYGSDAIAGVINIVLKSAVNELSATAAAGVHNASPPSDIAVLRNEDFDGAEYKVGANYGLPVLGTGFVNLTAEYLSKDHTNRAADPAVYDIYRRQYGDAAANNVGFFLNSRVPVTGAVSFYGFGGFNFRDTDAFAWSRDADSERNVPAIYPNGFDPIIQSDITDQSLSVGLQGGFAGWSVDLNNTFGSNRFHYTVTNTLNASLKERSPTRFDAGGFQFMQNTTGLNFTRFYPGVLTGLNVAFGTEFRVDNYEIFAGEEGSYRNYGGTDTLPDGEVVLKPGGSQGFPGFQPANELDETRTNIGAYVDTEIDLSERLMVSVAGRFENYSDFGNTLTGKVASRLELTDAFALRGSASTGFRAPSLAQVYFNSTFTDFVGGVATDKLIARNDSEITRALGIPPLREEKATNLSAGVTANLGGFSGTVDAYMVDVRDRIVLTGAFEDTDPDIGADLQRLGVSAAQFFTNALDTRTTGVDVVLGYVRNLGEHRFRAALVGNFNDMELGDIETSPKLSGKEDIYFGEREQYFLRASAPRSKVSLSSDYGMGRLETSLRVNRFGEVTLIDWIDERDVYQPRTTADLSVGYQVSDNLGVTVGGTNLFNTYPTPQDTETETGGLWDPVQMGFSGAFYFARLSLRL